MGARAFRGHFEAVGLVEPCNTDEAPARESGTMALDRRLLGVKWWQLAIRSGSLRHEHI